MKKWRIDAASIMIGFVFAVIISAFFLLLQGYDPIFGMRVLVDNAFGSSISRSIWMYRSVALMLTGISATVIFISGNANLGQQGTVLIGIITVLGLGRHLSLPSFLQIPVLLIAAAAAGTLWNGILIFFRFKFNMNEMIGSLMFNFIAKYTLSFLAAGIFLKPGATSIQSLPLSDSSYVPNIGAFITVLLLFFFLKNHSIGYEIEMKGLNPLFTRLSGCSNKKITIISTIISGSAAAITGAFLLMGGTQHNYVQGLEGNFGWDGIMMSMMSVNNILLIPLYSMFFAMLQTGAVGMEVLIKVPSEFTLIFQAITVFLCSGCSGNLYTLPCPPRYNAAY